MAGVRAGQLLSAEDGMKTRHLSLIEALPSFKQAMALSLPCRELCEALLSSCSCGMIHASEFFIN